MTLIQFLLLDVAFLSLGFVFLFFKRDDLPQFVRMNKASIEQNTLNIPTLDKLLEYEILARKEGSGIQYDSLLGGWNFLYVWKKGTDEEDKISSYFLRLFLARLELRESRINQENIQLEITNSISFGLLAIRFKGYAKLKGSQPLLSFFFENIELSLGEKTLITRSLGIPEEKDRPFFALISVDNRERWLSARGRGGGLAIWLQEDQTQE